MLKISEKIVKFRKLILILAFLLLIPSGIGYLNTKVNYDILYYLPKEIETMKGQDVLLDEFGKGAYGMFVCNGMGKNEVQKMKEAYYYFIQFDAESTAPIEIENRVRIMDNVIRFLCVKQEA